MRYLAAELNAIVAPALFAYILFLGTEPVGTEYPA